MSKQFLDAKVFGLIVQKDLTDIPEEEKPSLRRQCFGTKEAILEWIKAYFENKKVVNYVVAHEHGTEKGDCHYQCCIQLEKANQTRKDHVLATIGEDKCYILYEKGKKGMGALISYCKKDGDYICSEEVEEKTKKTLMERLIEKPNQKEQLNLLMHEMPKDIIKMDLNRMFQNIETAQAIIEEEPIKITFPDYLMEREPMLCRWYMTEMAKDKTQRRKALVLFSKERAMGKTSFAKGLVNNNEKHYIICRNNFNASDFNKPNAQLLILDDMTFVGKQTEMWKALVTSEATAIRDAYCNVDFKHGLPTIITTNNYSLFTFMMTSDYFKYECYFKWVTEYLGPEGTNPRSLKRKMEIDFDPEELVRKYGEPHKKIHVEEEDDN